LSKPIRVVIADDHALFRAGLRALLGTVPDIAVVAEATDGQEAFRLARDRRPHVLLMDITMPGLNGVEAAERIVREVPETRVIILSMHTGEEYVLRAIRAGAAGYLLKNTEPEELVRAVRQVSRGEMYLSPPVSRYVVQDYVRRVAPEADPLHRLTPRQREVLQLMAEGHTTKAIATKLEVSVKTVETHRAQLMDRLEIHDVPGLVRFAVRHGLVTPEP
jgi:DNA-binding NarL/FixJ family response regulator